MNALPSDATEPKWLEQCRAIEAVVLADPGGRGIGRVGSPHDLETALPASFATSRPTLIFTGFFIPKANACETDGPPGALAIGNSLIRLGCEVLYVTDEYCATVCRGMGLDPLLVARPAGQKLGESTSWSDATTATLAEYGCGDRWANAPTSLSPEIFPDLDLDLRPNFIAIERVGRTADGTYRNMRGDDLSATVTPIDLIYEAPRAHFRFAIGDGGNEIGMANVGDRVRQFVPKGDTIASVVGCDGLLTAGVSNWGGWAFAAALSLQHRRPLLPTLEEARDQLAACVAAGGVDGVTGRREETVDGLPWPTHEAILTRLHAIVDAGLAAR